jgi:hypothetical protein
VKDRKELTEAQKAAIRRQLVDVHQIIDNALEKVTNDYKIENDPNKRRYCCRNCGQVVQGFNAKDDIECCDNKDIQSELEMIIMENPMVVGLTWEQVSYYGNYLIILHNAVYLPHYAHTLELPEADNYHTLAIIPYDTALEEKLPILMRHDELENRIHLMLARWQGMSQPMQEIIKEDIKAIEIFNEEISKL